VILALIKKCLDARDEGGSEIAVWEDGTPTRAFLYVEYAADGIVLATDGYDKPEPVNLGSGFEINIRDSWSSSPR
jgi:GDP-L-fucose synthase